MKIAISGANGYLANLIRKYNPQHEYILISRSNTNYQDQEQLKQQLLAMDFEVFCHLAANTNTQFCENNAELAHIINVEVSKTIAQVCKIKQARLVFFSSEQIFNNTNYQTPITECATPNSATRYGQQKLACEQYITKLDNLDYLIIRLSWMFGFDYPTFNSSPNIFKQVYAAVNTKTPTTFKQHEKRGLTYAGELAKSFHQLINLPSGIYHYAAHNDLTTYQAARYIAQKLNYSNEQINQYILMDDQTYQPHPRYIVLDNQKIQSCGISIASFEQQVDACINDFLQLNLTKKEE